MPIDSVTSTTSTTSSSLTNATQTLGLGKDAFMSMLVASLKNQNPNDAADSQKFVEQISQLTMLEQITNMASATESLAAEQREARAVEMLGKTVTYATGPDTTASGVVEKVSSGPEGVTLTVGGVPGITIGSITEVATS